MHANLGNICLSLYLPNMGVVDILVDKQQPFLQSLVIFQIVTDNRHKVITIVYHKHLALRWVKNNHDVHKNLFHYLFFIFVSQYD